MSDRPPHLWAILPSALDTILHGGKAAAKPKAETPGDGRAEGPPYAVRDGVAVVSLVGPMVKGRWWGCCDTVAVRTAVRLAAADPNVRAVLLHVDSPGGTVAGTSDLADDVRAVAARKPVAAYLADCACSAAYWVAAQAGRVYANAGTCMTGSIGIVAAVWDYSEMVAEAKLKVHVIKTGEHKGAGYPGAPVTEAQLAQFQREINTTHGYFLAAVRAGRGLSAEALAPSADGRCLQAEEAAAAGLIDGVRSIDQVHAELASGAVPLRQSRDTAAANPPSTMKTDQTSAVAALLPALAVAAPLVQTAGVPTFAPRADAPAQDEEEEDKAEGDTDEDDDKAEGEPDEEPEKKDDKGKKGAAGRTKPAARRNGADNWTRASALLAAHPAHAHVVTAGINAGHSDDRIVADIHKAEAAALKAENDRLKAAAHRPNTGTAAVRPTNAGTPAPAPTAAAASGNGILSEAEFRADKALAAEFGGDHAVYAAYTRHATAGQIRLAR